jgi:hypothetical protein
VSGRDERRRCLNTSRATERRRIDAREQLRAAYELFVAIGIEAFAERAHRELVATDARVRKRSPETREELEKQIARLARDGLSNPQIGAQLFISAKTVEWNLRNVSRSSGSPLGGSFAPRCPTKALACGPDLDSWALVPVFQYRRAARESRTAACQRHVKTDPLSASEF